MVTGKCPHCGAVLRKLAQRTIADTRKRDEADPNKPIELILDESVELEITDTDKGGATIERSDFFDLDEYQKNKPPSAEVSGQTIPETSPEAPSEEKPKAPTIPDHNDLTMDFTSLQQAQAAQSAKPKTPTVPDRADQTMEFQAPPAEPPTKPTRRSTHTLESDKTVDLTMSPDDMRHLDSQWRGTIDPEVKQSQTLRQRETVTGFRSSLPVKSRYVREKRKAGAEPPRSLAEVPDYELLDIIGEGGMGVVYAAHQSSIARTVAVKMLKPSAKIREEQRDKFISEAVVTGELDHPNIVPIYDLGSNDEGALFYSMKRVRGTPWDKAIHKKQLDENLSILLRVADAVAFAHAGGVIHRDLKPENVMLGDYGEVLVMDWGLARITPEFAHVDAVYQADSLGGTPAYMSPEMAKGPVESINKTSDIYLLGAILYEIIGGIPPHSGRDVMQCLMAASQNRIDAIRYEGELKEIALKAMATQQEDRYQTVKEFQEAVRVYQSHSESLVLSAHANQNLQKARTANDYALFARALYGFQESLTLWDANQRARLLLTETQRDYATSALEKGDLDLAASLLDAKQAEHQALMKRIDKARAERNARQRRLRLAKLAVAGLIATVITTVTIAFFVANNLRGIAEEQKGIALVEKAKAEQQKGIAEDQTKIAVAERQRAEEQKGIAEDQTKIAVAERQRAEDQTKIAQEEEQKAKLAKQAEEYEAYIAQIGLANAKIDENAYDFALQLLDSSQPDLRNWEWGRLAHMCKLDEATYPAGAPVDAVAFSPDGNTIASGDKRGKVTVRDTNTGAVRFEVPHGQYVFAVAFSPDGRQLATASSDKTIQILDAADGKLINTLNGHTEGVLSVRFSPDGAQLVSGAYDNTARIWDVVTGTELQTLKGHNGWVWAAEFSPDGKRIVTAGQDGKAIIWQKGAVDFEFAAMEVQGLSTEGLPAANPRRFARVTEFTGHNGAVYSARFSRDGKLVVTGGYDKLVMVWNPDEVKPVDIAKRLDGLPDEKLNFIRMAGHDGAVRSVAFSPNDKLVVSGSEDNSLRVWDVATGGAFKALRGHGGIVRSCVFSPDGQLVLSGGDDESIRLWDVTGYQEVRVLHATVISGHQDAVLSAQFSRDGERIVTASLDRTASLWSAATGNRLKRFVEGHEFLVSGVVFYQDGEHLATGAGDNSVRVWNRAAGTQVAVLTPTGRIGTLAVSPDNRWLATGSLGNDVTLWNGRIEGPPLGTLGGHEAEISALAFSPNGQLLVSGDDRGKLRLWRLEAGSAVRGSPNPARVATEGLQNRGAGRPAVSGSAGSGDPRTTGRWVFERELLGHNGSISAIRFMPDGRRLVTASGDQTCAQWDLATGEELRDLVLKHSEWVSSLDLSTDGRFALTTCDDGIARLWRLADAAPIAAVKSPGRPFNSGGFSPDGSFVVLASSEDKIVRLWNVSIAASGVAADAAQASATDVLLDFNKLGGEVWAAMFAPDGRHILTIGGNDATMWDVGTRRPVVRYSPHGAVASAAVSPDGKLVATGSWDHSAKIWDIETGQAIRKLDGGHAGYVNSVEFSPDGAELLTASDDGTARLWDVETGKPTGIIFKGHTARVIAATFSPDGTRILTVSGDKTARIWDRATGNPIGKPLVGHKWAVFCGRFSADGQRIITGSQDKSAIIWDATTGDKLLVLEGHTATVTSVAFSPDGTRAVTGSQDYTAKLWDATTNAELDNSAETQQAKEILSLPGHTQEVTSVCFSPDGLNILTASRDGKAIIWLADDWRGEKTVAGLRRAP
jgi:WD40 repeat protein/serine/threonine protein kinase